MKKETFLQHKPEKGDLCDFKYFWKGKKLSKQAYFNSINESDTVRFDEKNWAKDFYLIPLKQLIYIKKA